MKTMKVTNVVSGIPLIRMYDDNGKFMGHAMDTPNGIALFFLDHADALFGVDMWGKRHHMRDYCDRMEMLGRDKGKNSLAVRLRKQWTDPNIIKGVR